MTELEDGGYMDEEILARRIFKEQIRKELLDEIRKYLVGWNHNGEMIVKKTSETRSGYIFIIPEEKYQELFR